MAGDGRASAVGPRRGRRSRLVPGPPNRHALARWQAQGFGARPMAGDGRASAVGPRRGRLVPGPPNRHALARWQAQGFGARPMAGDGRASAVGPHFFRTSRISPIFSSASMPCHPFPLRQRRTRAEYLATYAEKWGKWEKWGNFVCSPRLARLSRFFIVRTQWGISPLEVGSGNALPVSCLSPPCFSLPTQVGNFPTRF